VRPVSRFAPAPTGFLHLGHVVNALHVWGVTRAAGGTVLLRIEDHDRQRSRPEYERAILDDLDWLGFVPDEPTTDAFRAGRCQGRQRDRDAVYERALGRLHAAGLVYACECTRRDVQRDQRPTTASASGSRLTSELEPAATALSPWESAESERESELRYSGRCATRDLAWTDGRGLRVRLEPSVERFDDLRHGVTEQRPSGQCGDLLVRDRDGNWTYQFAVTVDDLEQGVTLVIRGDDLLESTGRQIQLARMLGRTVPPTFMHHGLIMKSSTQKLSKADGDTSVRDMWVAGQSVEAVIGRAMHAAGLAADPSPMTRAAAERVVAERYADAIARLLSAA
jgi:glutamyl-tRNA synthetase/glutamyl-Q tRNA(Asp) synthetase